MYEVAIVLRVVLALVVLVLLVVLVVLVVLAVLVVLVGGVRTLISRFWDTTPCPPPVLKLYVNIS